jgi:glycosyltransferase involved in cell wall biosynthesis
LITLYDAAETFVSLSWRESFGLPALEALACGLAVVVSGMGASPEVVGRVGVLVDPRDLDGAAREILAVLARPRTENDVAARVEQARRFSWDRCVERTLAVYEALTRRRAFAVHREEVITR